MAAWQIKMVHVDSDHHWPAKYLSNYLVHLFAAKMLRNGQGKARLRANSCFGARSGGLLRWPVAMEDAQTMASTRVPTNPLPALMWEKNQAAVKRMGAAIFGGLDP